LKSGRWQDLKTTDFAHIDPERTVAVLPVAAIEQHGPHLPLGTDALINAGILDATLERVATPTVVLALPPLAYGDSLEHADFAGTLTITAETLLATWTDIGTSVARAGVRKLVLFNSHGGQKAIVDLAALRLRVASRMLVARASYFAFGAPNGLFDADEWLHGIHGGEIETSLMLHLHPELVHRAALRNFPSLGETLARGNRWLGVDKPIGFGWQSRDLNPAGVCGRAEAADPERGARYLEHIAVSFATLLSEVAATPLAVLADEPS
jgi:creatinine amidohydrolase